MLVLWVSFSSSSPGSPPAAFPAAVGDPALVVAMRRLALAVARQGSPVACWVARGPSLAGPVGRLP